MDGLGEKKPVQGREKILKVNKIGWRKSISDLFSPKKKNFRPKLQRRGLKTLEVIGVQKRSIYIKSETFGNSTRSQRKSRQRGKKKRAPENV